VNTPLLQELFAAAVAFPFLASDDASFITASTFLVDGGISAAYVTPD
jgi:NAD(P)-dependent dehydrogenase (short-subunit alcohol dehydrogenase family)